MWSYGEVAADALPEKEVALAEEAILAYARTKLPFTNRPKGVFGDEAAGKPKRLEPSNSLKLCALAAPYNFGGSSEIPTNKD